MSYVALVRMQNGALLGITTGHDDGRLMEWPTEEQATKETDDHILAPLGIEVVEVKS